MEYYWTGLLFGLFGSFHCVGMCGPIVLAVPMNAKSKAILLFDTLLYNTGRITTYAFIGGLLSLVGKPFFILGYQQFLAVFTGVLLLIFLFLEQRKFAFLSFKTPLFFKKTFNKLLNGKNKSSLFLLGILNGFLPCGFVYMAAMGAILTPTLFDGAFYMMLFGIGTLPLLLLVSFSRNVLTLSIKNKLNKLKPYLITLVAILFIIRGLGLGIPYLSPKEINTDDLQNTVICE